MKALITILTAFVLTGFLRADDRPQWPGPERDGIWRENRIVSELPDAGPEVLRGVAEGKVCSLGAEGRFVCLDAATGELIWEQEWKGKFPIDSPVEKNRVDRLHESQAVGPE